MQEDHLKSSSQSEAETSFADYFHDPDAVADSAVAWQLESNSALLDAVRLLFQGSSALARLRLWALFTLVGQGKAFLSREELDSLYYALRPEVADAVIKRFRDAVLLSWDESQRQYGVTASAPSSPTVAVSTAASAIKSHSPRPSERKRVPSY